MTRTSFRISAPSEESLTEVVWITEISGLSKWSLSDYLAESTRDDSIFRIASTAENEVIGFIIGRLIPSAFANDQIESEIYNIGVAPAHRRGGIGLALLSEFRNVAKLAQVSSIWLEVRSANVGAIQFYENAGFEAVGERKLYYTNPADDAIIMRSTV